MKKLINLFPEALLIIIINPFDRKDLKTKKTQRSAIIRNLFKLPDTKTKQPVSFATDSQKLSSNIIWNTTDGVSLIKGQGTNNAAFSIENRHSPSFISAFENGLDHISIQCNRENENRSPPIKGDHLFIPLVQPYWRFNIGGVHVDDQIKWRINHGIIHQTNESSIIMKPNPNAAYGFTVFCEINRNRIGYLAAQKNKIKNSLPTK